MQQKTTYGNIPNCRLSVRKDTLTNSYQFDQSQIPESTAHDLPSTAIITSLHNYRNKTIVFSARSLTGNISRLDLQAKISMPPIIHSNCINHINKHQKNRLTFKPDIHHNVPLRRCHNKMPRPAPTFPPNHTWQPRLRIIAVKRIKWDHTPSVVILLYPPYDTDFPYLTPWNRSTTVPGNFSKH